MSTPVVIVAGWLLITAIAAIGLSRLLNRRPRYDRPRQRQPNSLRRAAKIFPVHGHRYDR